ncbi:hypothetical protein TrLO_g3152 [Triparma laevis f. longispina]|uniref:PLD phosphodiesterase domain-containing protein n=1 Tax=Triparma laevis f. longispina TaxID=1714387 RepID=A0A9W7C4M7_9STRA|nr:hypothetical protein TrLO_g3152 [Triparma laevis f. longispina]
MHSSESSPSTPPSKVSSDALEAPLLPLKFDGTTSSPRMSPHRIVRNAVVILLLSGVIVAASWILSTLPDPDSDESEPKELYTPTLTLIETQPLNYTIPKLPTSLETYEYELSLINSAKVDIKITVMYWSLLCQSSSYKTLGCLRGEKIYSAFKSAADRGVKLYFLQDETQNHTQLINLVSSSPNISYRTWNAKNWYSGGIMHQKLWVVDSKNVYLGSSNMDWLSLSQVKELGVGITSSVVGGMAVDLFDDWYTWAGMDVKTVEYFNTEYQVTLTTPCWSHHLLDTSSYCEYPFPKREWSYDRKNQRTLEFNGNSSEFYISRSPFEIAGEDYTADINGIISTIRSAEKTVDISVMDFSPASEYDDCWFNKIQESLLTVWQGKGVTSRVMVSWWAYSDIDMIKQMRSLVGMSYGGVEVGVYMMPGWNMTNSTDGIPPVGVPVFPGHSRVAHGKFIVTEERVNVGTSNYQWAYFYDTAGTSFNTDHEETVELVQQVFDRDWESEYTFGVEEWWDVYGEEYELVEKVVE